LLKVFGSTFEVEKRLLKKVSAEAFLYLSEDFEANLRFVSEKKIRELNRIYRNRDLPTDILSFSLDPGNHGGDIVICYKEVKSQAKKWRISVTDAAGFLLIHGILHLAGFEHTKTSDRVKMEKAEENILKKVGIKIER
jgi:probable rRNA maturation factor